MAHRDATAKPLQFFIFSTVTAHDHPLVSRLLLPDDKKRTVVLPSDDPHNRWRDEPVTSFIAFMQLNLLGGTQRLADPGGY